MSTLKTITIAATLAAAAFASPAQGATALCVPKTAGQTAFSGGDNPKVYCAGSKTILMPDSVAEQQTLFDMLPYLRFQASGVGGKPTIVVKGANLQVAKATADVAAKDGTGNLVVGDPGSPYWYQRTGSENLVVGRNHSWESNQNLIAGGYNDALGRGMGVVFGDHNQIGGGSWNTVLGGRNNHAQTDTNASVAGATVAGGRFKTASADGQIVADAEGPNVLTVRTHPERGTYDRPVSTNHKAGAYEYWTAYGQRWVRFEGRDLTNCSVTTGVVTPSTYQADSVFVSAGRYSGGWVVVNVQKIGATGAITRVDGYEVAVTAVC